METVETLHKVRNLIEEYEGSFSQIQLNHSRLYRKRWKNQFNRYKNNYYYNPDRNNCHYYVRWKTAAIAVKIEHEEPSSVKRIQSSTEYKDKNSNIKEAGFGLYNDLNPIRKNECITEYIGSRIKTTYIWWLCIRSKFINANRQLILQDSRTTVVVGIKETNTVMVMTVNLSTTIL